MSITHLCTYLVTIIIVSVRSSTTNRASKRHQCGGRWLRSIASSRLWQPFDSCSSNSVRRRRRRRRCANESTQPNSCICRTSTNATAIPGYTSASAINNNNNNAVSNATPPQYRALPSTNQNAAGQPGYAAVSAVAPIGTSSPQVRRHLVLCSIILIALDLFCVCSGCASLRRSQKPRATSGLRRSTADSAAIWRHQRSTSSCHAMSHIDAGTPKTLGIVVVDQH
jgi:uncharacterized protein YceK